MTTKPPETETKRPHRERKLVTLDPATIATMRDLGNGNLSAGIRTAAALLRRAAAKKKES